MKFLVYMLTLVLLLAPAVAGADCDQYDWGYSDTEVLFYSDGRTWDFTATKYLLAKSIEVYNNLGGPGTYDATIEVLVNGVSKASWTQSLIPTFINYTHNADVDFALSAGDTVTYKISGGTLGTAGGGITGPNYVKICGGAPKMSYFPPEITRAVVVGLNGTTKVFRLYLKGPAPYNIASMSIQGPSQTYNINPSSQVQGGAGVQTYFTVVTGEGLPANGDFTFTVTDQAGRSDSVVVSYTDATPPTITAGDITPADGAYTGSTTPTLSVTDQGGGIYYFFRIYDYDGNTIIWQSDATTSNSVSVPADVLQPNTPYKLSTFISPHDMNPDYVGLSMYYVETFFYTGTKANPPAFDYSWLIGNFNASGNPWRIPFFKMEGLAPWDFSGGNFQVGLTAPGFSQVYEDLYVQTRYWESCYYYSSTQSIGPTITAGTYNLQVTDDLANSPSVDRTYAQETVAPVTTVKPDNQAYVGSQYPMITWDPPAGATADWRYRVRLRRYGSNNTYIYQSPMLSGTSHKIDFGAPLRDNHTYILVLQVFTSATAGANEYINIGNYGATFHIDSRLSTTGFHIPVLLR